MLKEWPDCTLWIGFVWDTPRGGLRYGYANLYTMGSEISNLNLFDNLQLQVL